MKKIVKIRCGTCRKYFLPKSAKNVYCQRSCFKRAFYRRQKLAEKKMAKIFPLFKCPLCSNNINLGFDPLKEDNRWLDFKCPFCFAFLTVCVWDNISAEEKTKV